MLIHRTIEARCIAAGMRLTQVEGASVHVGIDGLLVEMAREVVSDEFEMGCVQLDVWHDTWMFGIVVEPEAHVQVTWDDAVTSFDPPEAPSRAGMIRVHGTWYPGGENLPEHVQWAPHGYPMITPEQR